MQRHLHGVRVLETRELVRVNVPDVVHSGGLVPPRWEHRVQPPPLGRRKQSEALGARDHEQQIVVWVLRPMHNPSSP